jgi:outer membrane lipoprotein carrier protein
MLCLSKIKNTGGFILSKIMDKNKINKNVISMHLKHNLLSFTVCFFSLFAINFLLFTVSVAASSVEEDIKRIQKAYENIKDISGNFIQKSHIKDLKRTDTYKGQFSIKRPMKMKWDYKGETAPEVLINNGEIIIYQTKEKQAFRGKFDRDTYGQAPIALLSGFGNIQEEFNVSKKSNRLILKPRKPLEGISSIEIVPSEGEFPISSFTINDTHSNRIDITLIDIKINTGLEDKFFEPSLPKDTTIYDNP